MQQSISSKQYKKSSLSETQEQILLVKMMDLIKYDGRPLRFHHSPNGRLRDKRTAAILKMMGTRPGIPDILIFDPPPVCLTKKGCVIELKKESGGSVSEEQLDWLDYFEKSGWFTAIARGADQAIEYLRVWKYIK
jgi:hypothetical protein